MNMREAFLSALAVAGLSACVQQAPVSDSANPAELAKMGEVYFKGYGCVKCHAIGGEGGTYAPDLTMVGFRKSAAWLDRWLKDPHAWRDKTVMPSFHLPENVRHAVVTYLSEQKGRAWGKNRPWNAPEFMKDPVARGHEIFDLAGCDTCHGKGGQGGYPDNNVVGGLMPSLTMVAEGYSRNELLRKIEFGVVPAPADPSKPAPLLRMPPWGQVLDKGEIEAVASYLFSLDKNAGKQSESNF